MQSSAWSLACLDALGQRGHAQFHVEVEAGELRGIAPLLRPRGLWPRCAELIGVELLTEPMDFIYADEATLDRLVARLAQRGQALYLPRLPAASSTLAALRRAFTGRALIVERCLATYPYIPLSDAWCEPELQLTSRRRSDLRRARKRAEETGPVTCEVTTPQPAELDRLLDEAWAIEARSWKGAAGTAVAQDAERAPFYRQYARRACEQGQLRLCWLRFGDTTVAMQYAIEAYGRFWLFKVGYDEQFARCSPGNLMICETLRYAAERGLASYEFLGQSADWTRVWTEQEHASLSVRVYPYTFSGLAALAADGLGCASRKLGRKLSWAR